MRHSFVYGALNALALMITANPALAVSCGSETTIHVEIYEANGTTSGISSIECSVSGSTITVIENWDSTNTGVLKIFGHNIADGAPAFQPPYTIKKVIHNHSGSVFSSIANELLDLDGNGSGDMDGLSFAQDFFDASKGKTSGFLSGFNPISAAGTFNAPLNPPTEPPSPGPLLYLADGSGLFDNLTVDQLGDRDFLNFFGGGFLPSGDSDEKTTDHITTLTFGLLDRFGDFAAGFLLAQTPNFLRTPVPEPGMLLIFGFGLAGIGAVRRRKKFL